MRGGREAIIVTELPYQVNKATPDREDRRARAARRRSRASPRSATSRTARASASCSSWAASEMPQIVLNQLYKHTQMQTTFGIIMLALVDRRPQVVNLKEMLEAFVELPPRGRHPADALRPGPRRGAGPHPGGAAQGRRAARPGDPAHPRGREPRRGPRRPDDAGSTLSEIQAKAILDMRLQRLTAARAPEDRRGARADAGPHRGAEGHPRAPTPS